VRGQLLFEPTDLLSVRIIGDYAKRDEDCCAAAYAPTRDVVRGPNGTIGFAPNSFAPLLRTLGGVVNEDPFARRVTVTPGRGYQSDIRDWGISGEVNWDFGDAKLTSITAYRDWRSDRGQDADFSNLDLIYRTDYDQQFKTFTQELRLQGKAFDGKLDWLVGGYFADETLDLVDNLRFGRDYGLLQGCRIVAGAIPVLGLPSATFAPAAPGCINPLIRPAIAQGLGPLATPVLTSLDRLRAISDVGATQDRFRQKDRTWAIFTHNVFDITDQLSLTLGARYTHDRKTLRANIASDSSVCPTQASTLVPIIANANVPASVRALAQSVLGLSCANNIAGGVDGAYSDRTSDGEWTGTAVLSYKPTDRLLTYASYSRGYKAGGYNLDRAGMIPTAASVSQLPFAAEKVEAYEIGAKYRGRNVRLGAAAFYQLFENFQLNTFNGISFIVENIQGCGTLAGGSGTDSDLSDATGACTGKSKAGVRSRGIELEASLFPSRDLSVDLGFTLADTKYRSDLAGLNGRPLPSALFQLPGSRLSNAPLYTVTGGATWTPELTASGISGLIHADFRYQSEINTGSDLLPEKAQEGVIVVNARLGLSGADQAWGIEFWAQNLFDVDYTQVIAGAPIQGSGSLATVSAGGTSPGNAMFIVFPAEPRTYGVTVRTKF
jgi:iron complex outermembrane recepter protein